MRTVYNHVLQTWTVSDFRNLYVISSHNLLENLLKLLQFKCKTWGSVTYSHRFTYGPRTSSWCSSNFLPWVCSCTPGHAHEQAQSCGSPEFGSGGPSHEGCCGWVYWVYFFKYNQFIIYVYIHLGTLCRTSDPWLCQRAVEDGEKTDWRKETHKGDPMVFSLFILICDQIDLLCPLTGPKERLVQLLRLSWRHNQWETGRVNNNHRQCI